MKKYKIYLVPHTHWDKEWYFIKDVSDVYLLDNMKNIINLNKKNKDEALFCWDGQYSVIDDYLKFYPEEKGTIEKLIKNKKLIVGPWYTQPDTFNTLGESIVRNLLIGYKLSKKLGHSMNVAYLPDTFGFNSNLPQIVSKTNNVGIINWRGASDELINNSLFNMWEAEDGTKYPVYNLFKHGYFTGVGGLLNQYHKNWSKDKVVDWNPDTRADALAKFYIDWVIGELNILKPLSESTNNRILMPVGSDQMPMVPGWKKIIMEMNKQDQEHEYILSDFEGFFKDVISDKDVMKKANKVKGQFRYGQYARAHKTISSSRYDIKQISREVENLLYKELEPISVMYKELGGEYEEKIIIEATKLLVSCHAHDSLGGCNTDETNRAIFTRLESAKGLVEGQITLIKKRIVDALELKQNQTILFNLEPHARKQIFNLNINTKKQSFEMKEKTKDIDFSIEKQIFFDNDNFKVIDSSLEFKESKLVTKNKSESDVNATNILLDDTSGRYMTSINFSIDMPGFGYKIIDVIEKDTIQLMEQLKENVIENDFYKIEFINNKMNLLDKNTGIKINNFLELEACIDAGDTYDFSPPHDQIEKINVLKSAQCFGIKNNKIQSLNLDLNYGFLNLKNHKYYSDKTQSLVLNIILKGNLIDLKINIDNKVKDIRWRVILDAQVKKSISSFADQSYSITERPIHDLNMDSMYIDKNWVDTPIEIESCESLVYLKSNDYGFAVFNKGTNEYQIIGSNDEKIAITLFRGVSTIGKRNLLYRKGRASGINDYPHPTPDSNLLKELSFNIGIKVVDPNEVHKLNVESKEFNIRSVYYQRQSINQFLWKGDTFVLSLRPIIKNNIEVKEFLNIKNLDKLVTTSIKKQFEDKGIIVRVYNPTSKDVKLESDQIYSECNLVDEQIGFNNTVVKPNEIRSFMVRLK